MFDIGESIVPEIGTKMRETKGKVRNLTRFIRFWKEFRTRLGNPKVTHKA